ncbi:hypothetical protein [Qipengyuania sp. JC766]|uniref:hypothetical protein n=1 Tax=Qipengyuania sp. JC766 TaxID=3232139 RepID=UPI00345A1AFB
MFDREFLKTKVGKAALISTVAMTLFVAVSTQMFTSPAQAVTLPLQTMELA